MTRAAYRCLVWMHPPLFRREFAGEMLWIYDEASQAGGTAPLFLDGFASLARQWFLRSGYWRIAVILPCAYFQVTLAGLLMLQLKRVPVRAGFAGIGNPELAALMQLTAFTVTWLFGAVMFLVYWWRRQSRGKRV